MNPEIEMYSPDVGINGEDGSDTIITRSADTTRESIARNGGQGRGL